MRQYTDHLLLHLFCVVPMWRIKSVHGHKSKTALVEDTSDVIYLKRHNKSEAEEKRIKRYTN